MNIKVEEGFHREKPQLFLKFEYDSKLIYHLKKIAGASWSQTHKTWYMANNSRLLSKLKNELEPLGVSLQIPDALLPKEVLNAETNKKIEAFIYWMRSKRYSESTVNTYIEALKTFLRYFENKKTEEINNDDVIRFNNEYILENKYSTSLQNQVVNPVGLK